MPKTSIQVLQICKKIPWPLKDGEAIAITHLSKSLIREGIQMDLISMNPSKHFVNPDSIGNHLDHYGHVTLIPIDNQVRLSGLFMNLFQKASYHISRFHSSRFEAQLIEVLQQKQYDIIQLESLVLAAYIPLIRLHSKAKIVLRAHNVEFLIWERLSTSEPNLIKKWYLRQAASKLKAFESQTLQKIDLLLPISEADQQFFQSMGYAGPSHTCPIVPELNTGSSGLKNYPLRNPPEFTFIGTLDWLPNQEGLKWYLQEVWPAVLEHYPEAKFYIAGRNAPNWLQTWKQQGVVFVGEVEDAAGFLSKSLMTVVPLLSGSGMRAKIIEALSLGHLVLSTAIGAEGIPLEDTRHYFAFNDAVEFVHIVRQCLTDMPSAQEVAKSGYQWVHAHYDSGKIAASLKNVYQELIGF